MVNWLDRSKTVPTVSKAKVCIRASGHDKLAIQDLRQTANDWVEILEGFEVQIEVTPARIKETGLPALIIEAIKPDEVIQ